MARRRTRTAKQAQALLVWLETLELPTRVLGALRRDLEGISGEREGEDGSGVLAGIDQARFTEELYRPRGGQIGQVSGVATSALEALRAVIPAPASANGAPTPSDDAAAPSQDDEELAPPVNTALQGAEAVPAPADAPIDAAPESTLEVAEPVPSPGHTLTDAVPAVSPVHLDAPPVPPKRRGRPPRASATTEPPLPPAGVPAARAKGRGRPLQRDSGDEAVAALPKRTRRARIAAALTASQPVLAPPVPPTAGAGPAPVAPAEPAQGQRASGDGDAPTAQLLTLWRELHPQGQRAALRFIVDLLANG